MFSNSLNEMIVNSDFCLLVILLSDYMADPHNIASNPESEEKDDLLDKKPATQDLTSYLLQLAEHSVDQPIFRPKGNNKRLDNPGKDEFKTVEHLLPQFITIITKTLRERGKPFNPFTFQRLVLDYQTFQD